MLCCQFGTVGLTDEGTEDCRVTVALFEVVLKVVKASHSQVPSDFTFGP